MISGSESGAIIAASLAIPDKDDPKKAKNLAKVSLKWFEDNGDFLFHDKKMSVFLQIFLLILFVVGFTALTEVIAQKCFKVTMFQIAYHKLLNLYKLRRKQIKDQLKGDQCKRSLSDKIKLNVVADVCSKTIFDCTEYDNDRFLIITTVAGKINTLYDTCK